MKGNPQDYMCVGLVHVMAYPRLMKGNGPVLDTLEEVCKDDYFRLLEISAIKRRSIREQARDMVRASGKLVAFAAQPLQLRDGLNLANPEPRARTDTLDFLKAMLDEASDWKAIGFEVLSGPDPGEDERKASTERLVSSLKELCEASRIRNAAPIRLETFDRLPFGKNRLIGPTEEAIEIAKAVRGYYPRFGLLLDLSHLPLLGETAEDALKPAAEYLKHVHIGNCVMRDESHPAYGDEHPPFGIEEGENGVDELAEFLRVLLEIGYIYEDSRSPVSFEIKPLKGQKTVEMLEAGKKTLDEAWAKI